MSSHATQNEFHHQSSSVMILCAFFVQRKWWSLWKLSPFQLNLIRSGKFSFYGKLALFHTVWFWNGFKILRKKNTKKFITRKSKPNGMKQNSFDDSIQNFWAFNSILFLLSTTHSGMPTRTLEYVLANRLTKRDLVTMCKYIFKVAYFTTR